MKEDGWRGGGSAERGEGEAVCRGDESFNFVLLIVVTNAKELVILNLENNCLRLFLK